MGEVRRNTAPNLSALETGLSAPASYRAAAFTKKPPHDAGALPEQAGKG